MAFGIAMPAPPAHAAAAGDLVLVSSTADGTGANDSSAYGLAVSDNGRFVAFGTIANNLDPADTDRIVDIYVKDLATGDVELASVTKDGVKSNSISTRPTISADGSRVTFASAADNLSSDDPDGYFDIYVKDLSTGDLTVVSTNADGTKADGNASGADISGNGEVVAFASTASNLTGSPADGESHIYVKNLESGELARVDAGTFDRPDEQSGASAMSVSQDGSVIAFVTDAGGVDDRDTDRRSDIYVRNLDDGSLSLASVGADGQKADSPSASPSLSADGSRVAFETSAGNLGPEDDDGESDVYVKDLKDDSVQLASTAQDGTNSDRSAGYPELSADGRYLAFSSDATNLGIPTDALVKQVYRKDLDSGALDSASVTAGGVAADYLAIDPSVSGDGGVVAFVSPATDLVPNDNKTWADVFAKTFAPPTVPDQLPPTVSISVLPSQLSASPGPGVVVISGTAQDDVGIAGLEIEIRDEYGKCVPSVASVEGHGEQALTWSRTETLDRTLQRRDRERTYTITVTATDTSGNSGRAYADVVVTRTVRIP